MLIRILLVAIALSGGFFATDIYQWFTSQEQSVSLDDYCLLTTHECKQGNNTVLADKDISQPMLATTILSTWDNPSAESLSLTLEGYEMPMGSVRFILTKTASGQFQGEVVLPICTLDAMTWYGTITDGTTSMNTSIRMER